MGADVSRTYKAARASRMTFGAAIDMLVIAAALQVLLAIVVLVPVVIE